METLLRMLEVYTQWAQNFNGWLKAYRLLIQYCIWFMCILQQSIQRSNCISEDGHGWILEHATDYEWTGWGLRFWNTHQFVTNLRSIWPVYRSNVYCRMRVLT